MTTALLSNRATDRSLSRRLWGVAPSARPGDKEEEEEEDPLRCDDGGGEFIGRARAGEREETPDFTTPTTYDVSDGLAEHGALLTAELLP